MSSNKKYWKSVEELKENSPVVEALQQNEFVEEIPTDEFLGDKESLESSKTSRRDFLKFVGFSTAAASLAACEGPVVKSIPYVVQPERIVPGVANYYATTMADGFDFSSVLVKTREGRPIKIENNALNGISTGAGARVHASVLSLYDNNRVMRPMIKGEPASWADLDAEVLSSLGQVSGDIVLLTQTFASPSTTKLIKEFSDKYGNVRHITYDTVSEDAGLNAFEAKYGYRALANYDFTEAKTIVSVGADFLGDWQGGGYSPGYAKSRIPKNGNMSKHIQFESNMTLSGASADQRIKATPSQQKAVLAAIYGYIVGGSSTSNLPAKLDDAVVKAVRQLRKGGSKSAVVSGIPEDDAQALVLEINETLGSSLMDTENGKMTRQGNAKAVQQLVKDMNAGSVGALLVAGVNPAYSLPNANEFVEGMKNVGLSVAFSMKEDETAKLCDYVAATPHYLESWGDVQFTKNTFGLMQPTIRPLFDTRQFQDTILTWTENKATYYEYLKDTWSNASMGFDWNSAVHDGVFEGKSPVNVETSGVTGGSAAGAAGRLAQAEPANGNFELVLYTKTALGDGKQANNPWLQELPDPITRTTWDNYITISKPDADRLGLENPIVSNGAMNGNYVNLKLDDKTIKNIPVIIQPGQAEGSIGLALGYGQKEAIQEEMQVGVNAYPIYKDFKAFQNVSLEKAVGEHEFACTQLQSTMVGRGDIVRETTLEIFNTKDREHWNHIPKVGYNHVETPVGVPGKTDIWESFDDTVGHHFNLSIDLNACTGCGACVIACHSENNVPVVGKDEVRKFRDMHWLRVDRYYSSADTFAQEKEDLENLGTFETFTDVETASYDNPEVAFQPVMCQHCNHAPCETVCPVAATSHGRQGQNQMAYNRCVGTRYCANNCPYKVRRFNWFLYNKNDEFDYNMNNDLGRMVLNPDVVVRSRGVMEKCSMCIQKTQKTILDAKREGRVIKDGEFQTACSQACDTGAIVFGDVNDKDSEVLKLKENNRMYHMLGDLGTKPNVMYQVKVKNTTEV